MKESDYFDILELCADIYDGNDFIPSYFHEWLSDKTGNVLFFGIEYKPDSKIVATKVVKVIDGGLTGMAMAARTHPKHRGKGIFSVFGKWSNKITAQMFPNMIRMRGTSFSSNAVTQRVQQKNGAFPIQKYGELYLWRRHIPVQQIKQSKL